MFNSLVFRNCVTIIVLSIHHINYNLILYCMIGIAVLLSLEIISILKSSFAMLTTSLYQALEGMITCKIEL